MPKAPNRDLLRKELGALKDARHVACQFFESDPLWPHGFTSTRREEIDADPVGWLAKFAIDLRRERGELTTERDSLRIAYSDLVARESAASAKDAKAIAAERAAHAETKERLSDALADVAENNARLRELSIRASYWEGVAIQLARLQARAAPVVVPKGAWKPDGTNNHGRIVAIECNGTADGKHGSPNKMPDGTTECGYCGSVLEMPGH